MSQTILESLRMTSIVDINTEQKKYIPGCSTKLEKKFIPKLTKDLEVLCDSKTLDKESITILTKKAIVKVESYNRETKDPDQKLNNVEKKDLVILGITKIVENSPIDNDIKNMLLNYFIPYILPVIIDAFCDIDINKIKSCFSICC